MRIDSDWTVVDQAMEAYNDAARAVAAEFKVPLLHLARQLPKSGEYFYDDVHSIHGCRDRPCNVGFVRFGEHAVEENLAAARPPRIEWALSK